MDEEYALERQKYGEGGLEFKIDYAEGIRTKRLVEGLFRDIYDFEDEDLSLKSDDSQDKDKIKSVFIDAFAKNGNNNTVADQDKI